MSGPNRPSAISLPSRLKGAFPAGVAVERVGLAEAVEITRAFVGPSA